MHKIFCDTGISLNVVVSRRSKFCLLHPPPLVWILRDPLRIALFFVIAQEKCFWPLLLMIVASGFDMPIQTAIQFAAFRIARSVVEETP